jgi:anti-sigma factor RsiW
MRCKEVHEILLTDYLDGQMDKSAKAAVEDHLSACSQCKSVLQSVREVGPQLFRDAGRLRAPESVWQHVKEAILSEQKERPAFLASMLERLGCLFNIFKPRLAVAAILTLFIIAGTVGVLSMGHLQTFGPDKQEQGSYLYSLRESMGDSASNGDSGLGTAIEEYFL